MKARLIVEQAPGGKRDNLSLKLPLSTPYVVQFFPIYACNFNCVYCHMSIPNEKRGFVTDKSVMDYSLFEKCINDLKSFPERVRTLRFVGMGEPLLHPDIVRMVRTAKQANVSNRIEIVSNGSLLTKEMSDGLIEAGLDRIVISLQGVSEKKYKSISGVDIDFERFVDGIKYLYNQKKDLEMYLKIVDTALESETDKKLYFRLFGDICDMIGIENTVPIFPDVSYNDDLYEKFEFKTQFGLPVKRVNVCPQAFYTMQINPDGKIVGCYSVYYPRILDDCNEKSLVEVWNGDGYRTFRKQMLDGRKSVCKFCEECNINDFRIFPEDNIDDYTDELKTKYGFV